MKNHLGKLIMSCSVAVLPAASVLAQENSTTLANNGVPSSSPHEPGWEVGVNSGYVGGSSAKFQGQRLGNSDAFNVNVEASTRRDSSSGNPLPGLFSQMASAAHFE